jgi:hypothetical protein
VDGPYRAPPMREARDPITQLRNAIDALPQQTRRAMLDGVRTNPIVVGAYTDSRGGICPMLAAHRSGSRVDYLPFARSWDAFARTGRVRRATRREVRVLEHLLVDSLEHGDPGPMDLGAAIADHQAALRRRAEREAAGPAGPAREFGEIRAGRLRAGDVARLRERFEAELGRAEERLRG